MHNLLMLLKKEIFPISLILILALAKLVPHPPNFTPVIAVAIISGYIFKNIYLSLGALLISMLLADVFLGFYSNMLFVYLSLFLIAFISFNLIKRINFKNLFIYSFFGSLLFFIVSNFGVWLLGSPGVNNIAYDKNLNGLVECYILAIPFFGNTFISTLVFSYVGLFSEYLFKKKLAK